MGIIQYPLFALKSCASCGIEQPSTEYYRDASQPDGRMATCKTCRQAMWTRPATIPAPVPSTPESRAARAALARERNATDPEYRRRRSVQNRLHNHGITEEQFNTMVEEQYGVCAICCQPPITGKGWHVDHDHDTGAIRGLLCHECNTGLGKFKDDPRLMETAAAYLRRFGK